MLTVLQALEILKKYNITDSEQMIRRWLREGRIKGQRSENRKEGWQIPSVELNRFIENINPAVKYQKEIEVLKARVVQLEAENSKLRNQLANIIKGNITNSNIRELNKNEIESIFKEVTQGSDEQPEIIKKAYEKLMRLFKDNTTTNFYNENYKNRHYVSPYTGKRYGSPEALIKAAIPWLIDSVKAEERRKEEKEKWWLIETP